MATVRQTFGPSRGAAKFFIQVSGSNANVDAGVATVQNDLGELRLHSAGGGGLSIEAGTGSVTASCNINLLGALLQNGAPYIGSQWTTRPDGSLRYASNVAAATFTDLAGAPVMFSNPQILWRSFDLTFASEGGGGGTLDVGAGGSLECRAMWFGSLVNAEMRMVLGSAPTLGDATSAWSWTLPVPCAPAMGRQVGTALMRQAGGGNFAGVVYLTAAGTLVVYRDLVGYAVTVDTPFAWSTGDELTMTFAYEASATDVALPLAVGLKQSGEGSLGVGLLPNDDVLPPHSVAISGTFAGSGAFLTALNASALTTGTLNAALLPSSLSAAVSGVGSNLTNLNACALATGTLNAALLPSTINVAFHVGGGAGLTGLNASALATGTLNAALLPTTVANAAYLATGTLNNALLPSTIDVAFHIGGGAGLTNLNASALATGTLNAALLPTTVANAAYLATGTLNNALLPSTLNVAFHVGGGAGLTGLNACALATGTLNAALLPPILANAAYLTSGTLNAALLPSTLVGGGAGLTGLNACALATGTINAALLPSSLSAAVSGVGSNLTNLNASALTTGILNAALLPASITNASTLTSGTLNTSLLPSAVGIGLVGRAPQQALDVSGVCRATAFVDGSGNQMLTSAAVLWSPFSGAAAFLDDGVTAVGPGAGGAITGRYFWFGTMVTVDAKMTVGRAGASLGPSPSTSGWNFTLPVPPAATSTDAIVGTALMRQAGGAACYTGVAYCSPSTSNVKVLIDGGNGIGAAADTPFAWAAGDTLSLLLSYEAAGPNLVPPSAAAALTQSLPNASLGLGLAPSAAAPSGSFVVAGAVGIGGIAAPAAALDVSGNINFSGRLLKNGTSLDATGATSTWTATSNIVVNNAGAGPALSVTQSQASGMQPVACFYAGSNLAVMVDGGGNLDVSGTNVNITGSTVQVTPSGITDLDNYTYWQTLSIANLINYAAPSTWNPSGSGGPCTYHVQVTFASIVSLNEIVVYCISGDTGHAATGMSVYNTSGGTLFASYTGTMSNASYAFPFTSTFTGSSMYIVFNKSTQYQLNLVALKFYMVTGNINAGGVVTGSAKNFEIDHPVVSGAKLIHTALEGPRADLVYRGSVTLQNGQAAVNIDSECNTTGGMTGGTFAALTKNAQVFLQNASGFGRAYATLCDNELSIVGEDATAVISWMVIAERKDAFMIHARYTDAGGSLVCERLA